MKQADLVALCQRVGEEVVADPVLAISTVEPFLCSSTPRIRGLALRVTGHALAVQGRNSDALGLLRDAVSVSSASGHDRDAAEARLRLAETLNQCGLYDEALDVSLLAEGAVGAVDLCRVLGGRALILENLMEDSAVLETYRRALSIAEAEQRVDLICRLRNNRAMFFASRRNFIAAEKEQRELLDLVSATGNTLVEHAIRHNLAVVLSKTAKIDDSIELFRSTDQAFRDKGALTSDALLDQAELFLQARLFHESMGIGQSALMLAKDTTNIKALPSILLVLARVALASGDFELATRHLESLVTEYESAAPPSDIEAAHRTLAVLLEADDIQEVPGPRQASPLLAEALTAKYRFGRLPDARIGTADPDDDDPILRIQLRFLTVVQQLVSGSLDTLESDIDALIGEVISHVNSIRSTELRARALHGIVPLEELVVEVSEYRNSPEVLWVRAELIRSALVERDVATGKYSGDAFSGAGQSTQELSAITAKLRSTTDIDQRQRLERQRANIEWEIRTSSWAERESGRSVSEPHQRWDGGEPSLASALPPDVVAVTFQASRTDLFMLLNASTEASRLVRVGPVGKVAGEITMLRTALRSILYKRHRSLVRDRDIEIFQQHLESLEAVLLPEFVTTARRIVIVPNGTVSAVPWLMLPSLSDKTVHVAPSLRLQMKRSSSGEGNRALIVLGPDLSHARHEARIVAEQYADHLVLEGEQASVRRVLELLPEVDVVHVASHGIRRDDQVFLSGIRLADGDLTTYDLQRVNKMPRTVVLSCCDLGAAAADWSIAPIGLGATLQSRGSSQIVMAMLPVLDRETASVMAHLHKKLQTGLGAPYSLQQTIAEMEEPFERLTAKSFVGVGEFIELGDDHEL